jgi:hypothetical protein
MKIIDPIPLINRKHKFILYTNCKCGGTLLKSWFLGTLELDKTFHNLPAAISNYGLFFVLHWYTKFFGQHDAAKILSDEKYIRFFIDCYRHATKKSLPNLQANAEYFKFAVIRDPYSRIVSAYVDKFCGEDLNKSWVQEVISSISANNNGDTGISFSQFIYYNLYNNNDFVNRHWRRQNYVMSDIKIDKFISLESINSGLTEVSNRLNVMNISNQSVPNQAQRYGSISREKELEFVGDISNRELMLRKNEIGYFPSKEQFYNDELRDKVKQIYREDFVRFSFDY